MNPIRILCFVFIFVFNLHAAITTEIFSRDEMYVQFTELPALKNGELQLLPEIEALFRATPILSARPVFPAAVPDRRLPGMDRVFRLKVEHPQNLAMTLVRLNASPYVQLAERIPVRRQFGVPNDPLWPSQYHLQLMEADSAFEIHTGSSQVAVAIIDGGVDYLHEDLRPDIWVNNAEDVDGDGFLSPADNDSIDSDGNGFLDDVIGWDFVNLPGQGFPGEDDSLADNEPMDFGGHGTHCAGDAAAATDNALGISSVGNRSQIMCVRAGMTASNGFGYIYYSVEGIYYAANSGAKVISMSYGGLTPSSIEQMAVDYAWNLGTICVAAAGNDNLNQVQYPANYNHVIAVAATDAQDHKAGFSNFGPWIDVSAPGVNILSTTPGGYGEMDGTSMATPIVAGLTGLAAAMFPGYTPGELVNRILAGCDSIDHLNPGYAGMLGAGRVNAFNTLDKAIWVTGHAVDDSAGGNGNNRLDYGEPAGLVLTLKNSWQNASAVTVTIHSLSPILTVLDSVISFGIIPLGGTANNAGLPFPLAVGTDTSFSEALLQIRVTAANGYSYQKTLALPIGQRDILLVNDDQPSGVSQIGYYRNALNALGKTYDEWDVQAQGGPGAGESNYQNIIWYTGESVQNVLTPAEQQFLENYLNNGGRLFLTGQNIAYDLVEQQNGISFFSNYLHASYVQNSSNDYALQGLPGDPIGAGQVFIILGSGGANNQNSPDVVTAQSPAQAAVVYDSAQPDGQAALTYNGGYRLVYFAFGWEGINDQGEAKRLEVLQRVLGWLENPATGLELPLSPKTSTFRLLPNYPNPFNPETTIRFALPAAGQVEAVIFNSTGQVVRRVFSGRLAAGLHALDWNGRDDQQTACASGVYLLRLRMNGLQKTQKLILLR